MEEQFRVAPHKLSVPPPQQNGMCIVWASQVALVVKNPPANAGEATRVWFLSQEGPLEEGMATHSSILAWRIPWTEELNIRLQGCKGSTGLQRVGHN